MDGVGGSKHFWLGMGWGGEAWRVVGSEGVGCRYGEAVAVGVGLWLVVVVVGGISVIVDSDAGHRT